MYDMVFLFALHVNHEALKIFFEYSRKIKQDSSMTQSPANLVPRASWPSDSFDSTDSVFFSTIKAIGKPRDPWGRGWLFRKFWFYIFTANGSYSYSHI